MKKLKAWWNRRAKWFRITTVAIVVIAVLGRILAPSIIKYQALSKLNDIEGYSATIDDVDVSLFSPSIAFNGVKIFSDTTGPENPLFQAKQIKGELMLCSINQGEMLTHTTVVNPILNFIQAKSSPDSTGETHVISNYTNVDSVNWREEIRQIFALTINEFDVKNGAIYFYDYATRHDVALKVDSINGHFENLANSQDLDTNLFASGNFSARLMKHAPLEVEIKICPTGETGAFDMDLELSDLDITSMNAFWREYVNLDVEKGHFALTSNVKMRDGILDGKIYPKSNDFDIFELEFDKNIGFKNMAWQALVGAATRILLLGQFNEDKICRIDFTGKLDRLDICLRKNSEALISKMFVNAVNKQVANHTVRFEKIED